MRHFTILIVFTFLFSCRQPNSENKIEIVLPDTATRHGLDEMYLCVKNLRRELNLKNLELGADSIEIRIYEDPALWKPSRLIIIKNENKVWNATKITYWERVSAQVERQYDTTVWWNHIYNMVVDSAKTENLIPKCSWSNLIDSLKIFNIYDLPSQQDIKGFQDNVNDGISYHFEIATKKRYKFYTYHCPDFYKDENNKNVSDILKLISRRLTYIMMCKES